MFFTFISHPCRTFVPKYINLFGSRGSLSFLTEHLHNLLSNKYYNYYILMDSSKADGKSLEAEIKYSSKILPVVKLLQLVTIVSGLGHFTKCF